MLDSANNGANRRGDSPARFGAAIISVLKCNWYSVVLILPVAILFVAVWDRRWICDDGFINLRIARNVVDGYGLVYNVGERVEAGTSTLWVLILAAAGLLGARLEWAAVVLGCALTGLAAYGALWGGRRLWGGNESTWQHRCVPVGLAIIAALPPMWDFGTSGLELGLTLAWISGLWALTVHRVAAPYSPGGHTSSISRSSLSSLSNLSVLLGACLIGLGPLVRPDLALYSAVYGALWLWLTRQYWQQRWWARLPAIAASALAIPMSYQVFRMGYFATLAPNTAYAKEAFEPRWAQGLHYVQHLFQPYALHGPMLLAMAAVGFNIAAFARKDSAHGWVAAAPLLGGLLCGLYVVRVGGDFMHGRMLLPAVFAILLPVSLWPTQPSLPSPTWGLWARRSLALALVAWAVVCSATLRVQRENIHGIGDERGWYMRIAKRRNAVLLSDYVDTRTGGFYGEAETLRKELEAGCPGGVLPLRAEANHGCERRLINDMHHGKVPGAPKSVPLAETAAPAAVGVTARIPIGISGYLLGPQVHVVDRIGLADPLASRMALRKRGRPGHEKILNDPWLFARFGAPDALKQRPIQAARRALACGPLAALQEAVTAPLTLDRFLDNIAKSAEFHRLRIPPEPELAEALFCDPRAPSLTSMAGGPGGDYTLWICPPGASITQLNAMLAPQEEAVSSIQVQCSPIGEATAESPMLGRHGEPAGAAVRTNAEGQLALRLWSDRFIHGLSARDGVDAFNSVAGNPVAGWQRGRTSELKCRAGEVPVGIQVRRGALVDALGLICAPASR